MGLWARVERAIVRRRTFFALVGPLPLLFVATGRPSWFVAGLLLSLTGALIRVWAAGSIVKDQQLCDSGPYAFVRNPLYLGTLLALMGYCVMSGRWWTPLVWLPLFALFYVPTIAREETDLSGEFGADYEAYRRAVPPLFPHVRRGTSGQHAPFSLHRALVKNREYQGMLGTLAMIALFAAANFWLR